MNTLQALHILHPGKYTPQGWSLFLTPVQALHHIYDTLDNFQEHFTKIANLSYILIGNFIYAFSVNMLITPAGLYNGGFLGIAQLIRYFMTSVLMIQGVEGTDITGIIYFLINIPLFWYAYKAMGVRFSLLTVMSIGISSVFLTFVPVPAEPLLKDTLTACVVGGVVGGIGTGLILRGGSSTGGSDIIGICLSRTHPDMSVGKINIGINLAVYAVCLIVFNVQTAVYSFIYTTIRSTFVDRMHTQNINVSVKIITKVPGIDKMLTQATRHGVTSWTGEGVYTGKSALYLYGSIAV